MEHKITTRGERQLKLREVTPPGMDGRVWEVEEAERGLRFKATLSGRALHGTPEGWTPHEREATEEEVLRAVGLAVDDYVLALRGTGQIEAVAEIRVNSQHVHEAMEASGS